MTQTDRLGLPLLAAGQAQKEVMHNEALALLDLMVQATVESADLSAPPVSPSPGACWIVAGGGSGDWAGRDAALAGWTAGGWIFATPEAGWRVWAIDRTSTIRFDGRTGSMNRRGPTASMSTMRAWSVRGRRPSLHRLAVLSRTWKRARQLRQCSLRSGITDSSKPDARLRHTCRTFPQKRR